jgi:predicted nuclease of predicted toxin-antitoxin system
MKVLVDENIPRMTVHYLRESGHDVRDVRGTLEQGAADPDLWTIGLGEQRLLITTDRGFTEYRATNHFGILIVRLRQQNRVRIHNAVLLAMSRFAVDEWPGLLVVVRDTALSLSRYGGPVEKL